MNLATTTSIGIFLIFFFFGFASLLIIMSMLFISIFKEFPSFVIVVLIFFLCLSIIGCCGRK